MWSYRWDLLGTRFRIDAHQRCAEEQDIVAEVRHVFGKPNAEAMFCIDYVEARKGRMKSSYEMVADYLEGVEWLETLHCNILDAIFFAQI